MLKVYNDDQNQATSKTIGSCLYRLLVPNTYNKKPVTKINMISQPILNADVGKSHVTTLHTVPSQSKSYRNSDIILVTPHYQEQSRLEDDSEALTIKQFAKTEPQMINIRELAEEDDKTAVMSDTSIDNSVTWDQKIGCDENINIVCPNPWTTIDPYDFHIQKVEYENHKIARRLRSFSQEHSSHFAMFKIFSRSTTTRESEHWMAGWARSGLSLNFVLMVAHKLKILSLPLRKFILSMVMTALELYNQNEFPIPGNPQFLCNCFQIWREEPSKFSLKFGMPYLAMEGHTTTNQQHTHAFLGFLEESFKKSIGTNVVNSRAGCQEDTMKSLDRRRVDDELSRIFAHKDCFLPQEKLNTIAERP